MQKIKWVGDRARVIKPWNYKLQLWIKIEITLGRYGNILIDTWHIVEARRNDDRILLNFRYENS